MLNREHRTQDIVNEIVPPELVQKTYNEFLEKFGDRPNSDD